METFNSPAHSIFHLQLKYIYKLQKLESIKRDLQEIKIRIRLKFGNRVRLEGLIQELIVILARFICKIEANLYIIQRTIFRDDLFVFLKEEWLLLGKELHEINTVGSQKIKTFLLLIN